MNNLAIIPARGGSKRIPRKNIKPFLGKPIMSYSIEAALRSGLFSEIMVSTDDEEIAEIARSFGASVPFMRSARNASDYAPLADVVNEVLDYYHGKFTCACCILPTAPLIQITHLRTAFETMIDKNFSSVRPVVPFSYPIQRALALNNDGGVEWFYPEYAKTRSQDIPAAYHDAGQFYWMYANRGLIADNRGAIILSEMEVQDIDNEQDWKLAELKYKLIFDQ